MSPDSESQPSSKGVTFPINVTLTAGPAELTSEQLEDLSRRGVDVTALSAEVLAQLHAAGTKVLEFLSKGDNLEEFRREPATTIANIVPDVDFGGVATAAVAAAGPLIELRVMDKGVDEAVQKLVGDVLRAAQESGEVAERLLDRPLQLVSELGKDQSMVVQRAAAAALGAMRQAPTGATVRAFAELAARAAAVSESRKEG